MMKIKKYTHSPLLVMAALIPTGVVAAADAEWEHYEDVGILVTGDQLRALEMKFYEGKPATYFAGCSDPIKRLQTTVSVKFTYRKEIESFTVRDAKWGNETFKVDLSALPEARKWILSTIIKRGKKVQITSRACGSGVIPYLIAVKST